MPATPEQAVEQAQYQDMLTRDAVYSYFERRLPPAQEPLDPVAVNVLAGQLERAVSALSGGQVAAHQLSRVPRGQPVDRLPVDVFTELAALSDFTRRAGLPGLDAFAPSLTRAARSTEGVLEAAQQVTRLADPAVAAAIIQATGGKK